MRIVFRTDASQAMGSGHVMRCLTLARALREEGAEALFVCREHAGNLIDFVGAQGFPVARLPVLETLAERTAMHRQWLGASPQEDAAATLDAIAASGFADTDWIIVDHYALNADWERAMRGGRRIMTIDDLADREHDCDLLLDQNLVANFAERYDVLVPPSAVKLLGPRYALLQPEYAQLHVRAEPRQVPPRRVLVYFGAADTANLSAHTLSAFLDVGRDDVALDLVVGPLNPHAPALQALATGHANLTLHGQVPSLAGLMLQADLAIGAGGATTWERLCLKLPSILIILADNQSATAAELRRRGLATVLGDAAAVDFKTLRAAVEAELDGTAPRPPADAEDLVDGRGVDRVCAVLTASRATPLHARQVAAADEDLLLEWANDPGTRAFAFNPQRISPEGHRRWLAQRLGEPDRCRFYIVETSKGVPAGQVRFDHAGESWVVNYALAPQFRGRGLGTALLVAATRALAGSGAGGRLVGEVMAENAASHKIFRSLGYSETLGESGVTRYEMPLNGTGGV